jgi:hypothetical protein
VQVRLVLGSGWRLALGGVPGGCELLAEVLRDSLDDVEVEWFVLVEALGRALCGRE